ncbi:PREDICTED: sodium channel protein Nach-like isoform X1 [Polistes canadensis]|uniref:sodium channel protein Nach-like isoform X1 n=1 Tax=Polistes canadensis TaxID=91411 RepID=UPI000718ED6E|nr:PREDICTED: sodium channel protein Nach-like isoform X1 [Polistes canadensis]
MKYNYLPPLSYMRNSFKRRSKEYLLESSLHGVPYFADPTRPKLERGLWFLLTIASIVATIITIKIIWDKFQNNPTLTELDDHVDEAKISFPQIFLCFEGNQLNLSGINNLEKKYYVQIYEWMWNEKINDETKETLSGMTNFRNVFQRLTPRCDSILNNAIFTNKRHSRGKDFKKIVTPAGVCCKFNFSKLIVHEDMPFEFHVKSLLFPLKLYVADKFDIGPSRNIMPHIKLRKPSFMQLDVFQTYVTPDFQMLSDFQRQCHYRRKQWSYNNCQLRCRIKDISKKCNCLPWFLIKKGVKECSLDEYSCLTKVYDNYIDCKCILPCNFTVYRLLGTKEGFVNDTLNLSPTKITLNWPNMLFRREVRFGYMDLVVSFGGIAGLFLGYSLLSTFELFYYLSFRTYCGAVLDSSRKSHNIVNVRSKKITCTNRLLKSDIKFIFYNNFDHDQKSY